MSFSGLSIVDDNVIFCRRVGCICFIHPESVHINPVHGLRVVHGVHGGHGAETVGWYFAAHREFTAGNPEHAIWCVLGYGNFVGNRGAKADPPMVGAPSSAETTGESHAVLKTNNEQNGSGFAGLRQKACLDSEGAGRTCLATGATRWLKSVFHSARRQLLPFWAAPLVIDSIMRSRLKLPGFWRCGNSRKLCNHFAT